MAFKMTEDTITPENIRGYTKDIWFIPGANATPTSFKYIKEHIENDPEFNEFNLIDISYNCQENLVKIVEVLALSAPKNRPLYIIGHSLGGVLATAISQRIKHFSLPATVNGIISLSSPFGGSESANYLRWMYPSYHLFKSISTNNRMITDLQSVGAVVPTLSLVTSSGNNPLFSAANDGVVTVNSQRSLTGVNYVELPYNHFEILLAQETIDHIKVFLRHK